MEACFQTARPAESVPVLSRRRSWPIRYQTVAPWVNHASEKPVPGRDTARELLQPDTIADGSRAASDHPGCPAGSDKPSDPRVRAPARSRDENPGATAR